ncbi:MAG: YqgE/AlgH family protein, partial [Spirochaetales bacterium]|nr:YqgE/AlgH family protein [Spirochaetales bacterium]
MKRPSGLFLVVRTIVVPLALLLPLSPGWADGPREPARGTFLVASRELVDPNFRQTVVLLLEYGKEGAVGLVANRPSEVPLATL